MVRQADYTDEAAFTAALQGVDKLLPISSSEVGQRTPQHRNVIHAAKAAGVKFIAYTSLLHADKSPLGLHVEHVETEKMLADSGIPLCSCCATAGTPRTIQAAALRLEHGVFTGAAGDGKSSPPRRPAPIMPRPPHARSSLKRAMPGGVRAGRMMKPGP